MYLRRVEPGMVYAVVTGAAAVEADVTAGVAPVVSTAALPDFGATGSPGATAGSAGRSDAATAAAGPMVVRSVRVASAVVAPVKVLAALLAALLEVLLEIVELFLTGAALGGRGADGTAAMVRATAAGAAEGASVTGGCTGASATLRVKNGCASPRTSRWVASMEWVVPHKTSRCATTTAAVSRLSALVGNATGSPGTNADVMD